MPRPDANPPIHEPPRIHEVLGYQNYIHVMTFTLKKFSSASTRNELQGGTPGTNIIVSSHLVWSI